MATTLEELAARVEALERAQTATPVSYYTSRYSGEEMDERLDTVGVLGGSTQQALANLGAGVRPGLGINMDFSINQRGQSHYTANGYTVDGWKAQLTNLTSGSVEFKNPGVIISATGETGGYLDLVQYIEGALLGETLTFSVLYDDGTFFTITGTVPSEIPSSNTTFAFKGYEKGGIWLRLSSAGLVFAQIRVLAGYSTSPIYAKPEEGPDQTLAYKDESGVWRLLPQPDANYTTQLLRCQRYQYIGTFVSGPPYFVSSSQLHFIVPAPQHRAIIPSIYNKSGFTVFNSGVQPQSGFDFTMDANIRTGQYLVIATKENHGLDRTAYLFVENAGFDMSL